MTRTARMSKKKHLEATSWEEMRLKGDHKDEQESKNDLGNDEKILESQSHKKKSRKREKTDVNFNEETGKKKKKIESSEEKTELGSNDTTEIHQEKKKKKKKTKGAIPSENDPKPQSKDSDVICSKNNSKNKKDRSNGKNQELKTHGSFKSHREQKLEKQREARRRRRAKRKGFLQGLTCFHCRQTGHTTATCPQTNNQGVGVGVCYKCGSSSHTTKNCKVDTSQAENPYPFAKCFICGETGHLSRSCPDNPRGLYPKGGGCNICGSVEHLKRDCPDAVLKSKKTDSGGKSGPNYKKISKFTSADAEVHSDDDTRPKKKFKKKTEKVVQF
ncbi:zinc finger CCHC domain-containing protein 9 [Exaiptasia diaphana]|uniref:CCHC-type domain-containing protein n=1 Tax=Exaiptasia diaphana TaxID=2652724 RepID=A0A913Y484_EXADI|nr:zinc finger CCHC domain-containing protein 9 [Exaiptasia diaphana]KXJ22638.1 Zinc finger CCHC domain-containing protein 9 [Exaiptasia diaphana]